MELAHTLACSLILFSISKLEHQEAAASAAQCSSDRSWGPKMIPHLPVAEDVTLAACSAED